jgi:hypothetical protein
MLPMVWLPAGENKILQALLYGNARVVLFPNSSTIVELSYTYKVMMLLGIVGVAVVATKFSGTPAVIPVSCCACTKLPLLLSIPNVRSSVESIAPLYKILLLNI